MSQLGKWSHEVVVNTAIGEWAWDQNDMIMQERNSQYVMQQVDHETELVVACNLYNKGFCKFQATHYGPDVTLLHVWAFSFGIDGSREQHQSRLCGKRRSSANYFRLKEDVKEGYSDKKAKGKKPFYKGNDE